MSGGRAIACAACLVAASAPSLAVAADGAPASPGKLWAPTASLAVGSFDERMRVRVDGTDYDSYRSQFRMLFALGLAHPIVRLQDPRMRIDGHASVGVGPTFTTGHWQVPIREDAMFAYAATPWLTLRAGLGLGITDDATAPSRSFAEIGVPLSVTFWRTAELLYRPALSIPLGSESSPVFGGERELQTRLAFLPFEIAVRVRVQALGW
jgi:hypothetical protein